MQESMIDLIILIMSFSILSVKIMNINMKPNIIKYSKIVLMIILIIGPIGYQSFVIIENDNQVENATPYLSFNTRNAIIELVEFLQNYFTSFEIGVGFDVPGVALHSKVPIIDIYSYNNFSSNENFNNNNVSQVFENFNIVFIITLSEKHVNYFQFENMKQQFTFFNQPSDYTNLIYANQEFLVWRIL